MTQTPPSMAPTPKQVAQELRNPSTRDFHGWTERLAAGVEGCVIYVNRAQNLSAYYNWRYKSCLGVTGYVPHPRNGNGKEAYQQP